MTRINVMLTFQTPLNIGSGAQRGTLADRAMIKDHEGWPYVPASAFKGCLRHAVEQVAAGLGILVCVTHQDMCPRGEEYCAVCRIFGSPWLPGKLYFARLELRGPQSLMEHKERLRKAEQYPATTHRYGVAISRRRGVSDDKLLYTTELLKPGVNLIFGGVMEGDLSPGQVALVLAGLKTLPALGRGKSGGLGWLQRVAWNLDGPGVEALQTPAGLRAALKEVTV
jgi:CRISPR/Cas system CSM-associated protein Csm3 (group 7 of RAMP superfamily)